MVSGKKPLGCPPQQENFRATMQAHKKFQAYHKPNFLATFSSGEILMVVMVTFLSILSQQHGK